MIPSIRLRKHDEKSNLGKYEKSLLIPRREQQKGVASKAANNEVASSSPPSTKKKTAATKEKSATKLPILVKKPDNSKVKSKEVDKDLKFTEADISKSEDNAVKSAETESRFYEWKAKKAEQEKAAKAEAQKDVIGVRSGKEIKKDNAKIKKELKAWNKRKAREAKAKKREEKALALQWEKSKEETRQRLKEQRVAFDSIQAGKKKSGHISKLGKKKISESPYNKLGVSASPPKPKKKNDAAKKKNNDAGDLVAPSKKLLNMLSDMNDKHVLLGEVNFGESGLPNDKAYTQRTCDESSSAGGISTAGMSCTGSMQFAPSRPNSENALTPPEMSVARPECPAVSNPVLVATPLDDSTTGCTETIVADESTTNRYDQAVPTDSTLINSDDVSKDKMTASIENEIDPVKNTDENTVDSTEGESKGDQGTSVIEVKPSSTVCTTDDNPIQQGIEQDDVDISTNPKAAATTFVNKILNESLNRLSSTR